MMNTDGSYNHELGTAAVSAAVNVVEGAADATGISKAVHKVTGGKRVLNPDGSYNHELGTAAWGKIIEASEKVADATGVSEIVYKIEGGNRYFWVDGYKVDENSIEGQVFVAGLSASGPDIAVILEMLMKKYDPKRLAGRLQRTSDSNEKLAGEFQGRDFW